MTCYIAWIIDEYYNYRKYIYIIYKRRRNNLSGNVRHALSSRLLVQSAGQL